MLVLWTWRHFRICGSMGVLAKHHNPLSCPINLPIHLLGHLPLERPSFGSDLCRWQQGRAGAMFSWWVLSSGWFAGGWERMWLCLWVKMNRCLRECPLLSLSEICNNMHVYILGTTSFCRTWGWRGWPCRQSRLNGEEQAISGRSTSSTSSTRSIQQQQQQHRSSILKYHHNHTVLVQYICIQLLTWSNL